MCKQPTFFQVSCAERHPKQADLLKREKRPYSYFPSELLSFWIGNKKKPFKKDNLRQSLARAVQTLKLTAEGKMINEFKNGLLLPEQNENETTLSAVRQIVSLYSRDIGSFTFPKTCLRKETRRPAKYRSKDRSWNTHKWEDFCSRASCRSLLKVVLDLLFTSYNFDTLCKQWKRTCCPSGLHEDASQCEARWRGLREYCMRDCRLEFNPLEQKTEQ